jgi:hypothetical protein
MDFKIIHQLIHAGILNAYTTVVLGVQINKLQGRYRARSHLRKACIITLQLQCVYNSPREY